MAQYTVDLRVQMTIKWPHAGSELEAIAQAAEFVTDIFNSPEDDPMLDDEELPMVLGCQPIEGTAEEVTL